MGAKIGSLQLECEYYMKLGDFVLKNKLEKHELYVYIARYIELWKEHNNGSIYACNLFNIMNRDFVLKELDDENDHDEMYMRWIYFVHKTMPVDFSKNILNEEKLKQSTIKQLDFIKKFKNTYWSTPNNIWRSDRKERYLSFLDLVGKCTDTKFAPNMIVDFIWHAHMNNHKRYIDDCINCYGRIIDHDDSLSKQKDTKK